jgi:hypothetical protein
MTAVMIKKCRLPAGALVIRNKKNTVAATKPRNPIVSQRVSMFSYLSRGTCRLILQAGEPAVR